MARIPPSCDAQRRGLTCRSDFALYSTEQWLYEVKFDGWRIQLHKHGGSVHFVCVGIFF
jgi:hypothetical protein